MMRRFIAMFILYAVSLSLAMPNKTARLISNQAESPSTIDKLLPAYQSEDYQETFARSKRSANPSHKPEKKKSFRTIRKLLSRLARLVGLKRKPGNTERIAEVESRIKQFGTPNGNVKEMRKLIKKTKRAKAINKPKQIVVPVKWPTPVTDEPIAEWEYGKIGLMRQFGQLADIADRMTETVLSKTFVDFKT